MKISASILAADQNNIINNLNDKKDLFDYVHIDIGDNVFCPTYGISKNNVYKLVNETTYKSVSYTHLTLPTIYSV